MTITVTLLCSPALRTVLEQVLTLEQGTTAVAAVRLSRIGRQFPAFDWQALAPGIWGKAVAWDRMLLDGDRLELCRPLEVDPKVARRERFRRQGVGTAGLFARRREGGKAGY
jgi:putative ubiquitin-RnfH superfamily antitoxin RatB of RatAB toxin-antitoxin module